MRLPDLYAFGSTPDEGDTWPIDRRGAAPRGKVRRVSSSESSVPQIGSASPKAALPPTADRKHGQASDSPRRFRSLFLSDTHLGAKGCRADRLLDFLTRHDADMIYLVGDIFDSWQTFQPRWSPVHDAVLQNLMGKVRKGGRIVYVPGNHDRVLPRHHGVYFDSVEVVERVLHTAADGTRYLIVHGDCFDVVSTHAPWLSRIGGHVDRAMRAADTVLNRVTRFLGLTDWSLLEKMLSRVNRMITRGDLFGRRLATMAREHAAAGVICGHFHSAAIHREFGVLYANCGDWLENCTAIAEDDHGRLHLIAWKGSSPVTNPCEFSSA